MYFSNVVGQSVLKKNLINAVRQNRISHALLFMGRQGVGKLPISIALAQFISCTGNKKNDVCGNCNSCIKHNKLIHPDLHFTFPIVKQSKSKMVCDDFIEEWREFVLTNPYNHVNNWYKHIGVENKQGQIYTDESERIIKKLNLKPYESAYKTLIIWLPEKMNIGAANKLLKLVEEPYEKTLILFVSEEPEDILPTIRSRTQHIVVPPVDMKSLETAIRKKYVNTHSVNIRNIVHLSNGSYTNALQLLDENSNQKAHFYKFVEMMRCFYIRNIHRINEWSEKMAKMGREQQKSFLSYTLFMIRENFILNYSNANLNFLNEKEKEFSSKTAYLFHEKNIEQMYDTCTKAYNDISRNANAKLVFFDFSLHMVKWLRS